MIRKKINTVKTDPKMSASVAVSGGAVVRQSYLATGSWYPDRTLVPIVLVPVIGYTDPSTGKAVENAASELTDGHWYRLDRDTATTGISAATEITNGMPGQDSNGGAITLYDIDTTAGSATYGKLTVRENVSHDNPVTYVFVATHAASGRKVMASFGTSTQLIEIVPEICFDNNALGLYNPLKGERHYTLNPFLNPSSYPVKWSWLSYHEGKWGALGSTAYDWAVTKSGDGIKIDRSVMQDTLYLKCVAEVTLEEAVVTLEREVTHTRRMPKFEFDITRVGMLQPGTTEISPYALLRTGREVLSDVSEFKIGWYGSGSSEIAAGQNPRIRLSALGSASDLGLDVKDRGGWKLLLTADGGKYLTTADGRPIIAR
ncbi:MAG: hypothetical protein K1V90_08845 [Muribaculaceae bacterium]